MSKSTTSVACAVELLSTKSLFKSSQIYYITLYHTSECWIANIENICRRQNEYDSGIEICLGKHRKKSENVRKNEKMLFTSFSLSHNVFFNVTKTGGCLVKD